MGLGFTEGRPKIGSDSSGPVSTLVAGVIEKGGSLAEVCMDHTSSVSPGDEVVAVGGSGGLLKYFKTDDPQTNGSLRGHLAEAIDAVADPVRLQLERPLDPIEVPHILTCKDSVGLVCLFSEDPNSMGTNDLFHFVKYGCGKTA